MNRARLFVAFFGSVVEEYNATFLLVSFLLFIAGFGLLYVGSATFCSGKADWPLTTALVVLGGVSTVAAFALGYSGIGTVAGNILLGALMLATAYQYWIARAESRLLMTIVRPIARSSRSSSRSSTRARGSRPDAGSSSSSSGGSWTRAWARQRRCCMPRESAST